MVKDQDVAREEQRIAGLHILTEEQTATPVGGRYLCTAWASDQNGWRKIRVVMDSGAAECVAPKDMCPQYVISDSVRAGQEYSILRETEVDWTTSDNKTFL